MLRKAPGDFNPTACGVIVPSKVRTTGGSCTACFAAMSGCSNATPKRVEEMFRLVPIQAK